MSSDAKPLVLNGHLYRLHEKGEVIDEEVYFRQSLKAWKFQWRKTKQRAEKTILLTFDHIAL